MLIDYDKPILNKKGEPLRILMVSHHHCIRVTKRFRALQKMGYKVDGLANRTSYGTSDLDNFSVYDNEKQFKNFIRENKDRYDILDYSNEPDHPVIWMKEIVEDTVPIIVDLHDLDSIRREVIPIPERSMINCADGLIYVSQTIQSMINNLHRITIPTISLFSYCNNDIVDYEESKIYDRRGLVYEGGANPPEDTEMNRIFSYRSLFGIIKKLVEMGNETSVFCGNISAYDSYQPTGARIYPPTVYNELMNKLINFRYGVLIFNNEDGSKQQVNYTLTNKEFEYLMAGLPSLACWCPESMKHVKKHGIGFTFDHIEEIDDCSMLDASYLSIMDNIRTKRKELVMENFIWRLENLYATVLKVSRKGISDNIRSISNFEYGEKDVESLTRDS